MVSDGSNGAIITWSHRIVSGANADIYAQRISPAGVVYWTTNGAAICTNYEEQLAPTIIFDGSNGAIVTWYDQRGSGTDHDIYAQNISFTGGVLGGTVDMNEITGSNQLNIYPNPSNNRVTITSKEEGTFSIANDLGQVIQSFKLNAENNCTLNFETLTSWI